MIVESLAFPSSKGAISPVPQFDIDDLDKMGKTSRRKTKIQQNLNFDQFAGCVFNSRLLWWKNVTFWVWWSMTYPKNWKFIIFTLV